jgi:hypothetical protein
LDVWMGMLEKKKLVKDHALSITIYLAIEWAILGEGSAKTVGGDSAQRRKAKLDFYPPLSTDTKTNSFIEWKNEFFKFIPSHYFTHWTRMPAKWVKAKLKRRHW